MLENREIHFDDEQFLSMECNIRKVDYKDSELSLSV